MEIENVITWKNGKVDNPTPLNALNLNKVNVGTEEALNSLETQINSKISEVKGEIDKAIEDTERVNTKMKTVRETSIDCYGISVATQQMLNGYYLEVVETKPSSLDTNTIYFITGGLNDNSGKEKG